MDEKIELFLIETIGVSPINTKRRHNMGRKRKFSDEFKANIALEAIKGERTVAVNVCASPGSGWDEVTEKSEIIRLGV